MSHHILYETCHNLIRQDRVFEFADLIAHLITTDFPIAPDASYHTAHRRGIRNFYLKRKRHKKQQFDDESKDNANLNNSMVDDDEVVDETTPATNLSATPGAIAITSTTTTPSAQHIAECKHNLTIEAVNEIIYRLYGGLLQHQQSTYSSLGT